MIEEGSGPDDAVVDPLADYRSLRRIKTALAVAMTGYLAATLAALVFDVEDWLLTTDMTRGVAVHEVRVQRVDGRLERAATGLLLAYVATAIIFLTALYRLARNARALTAGETLRSPAAAVVWFFVPVLHLFMPYLTVQQIWRASVPTKTDWRDEPPSVLVKRWWAFWLFSIGFGTAERYFRLNAETPQAYRTAVGTGLLLSFVNIALTITALLMVCRLARLQDKRHSQLRNASKSCVAPGEPTAEEEACAVCGRVLSRNLRRPT